MESIHCRLYNVDSTFEFAEGQLKLSTWKLQRKVLTESFSWEFQLETIPQLPTFWPLESCGGFARSALHRWTEETTRDKERRHKKRQQEKRKQEERVLWCSLSAGLSQCRTLSMRTPHEESLQWRGCRSLCVRSLCRTTSSVCRSVQIQTTSVLSTPHGR